MTTSTTSKATRFKYAATLLGAFAIVALAPATANALPVDHNGESGGCTYTDADGYDIPIDEGQTVFVDGKLVTCKSGSIVVTTAPSRAQGGKTATTLPGKLGNAPVLTVN
jgi:hypothetical protein